MGNEFSQDHGNIDISTGTQGQHATNCGLTTAPLVSLYERSRIQRSNNNSSNSTNNSNNNNNNNNHNNNHSLNRKHTPSDSSTNESVDVCFICSDPIEIFSVSRCNHRTCHLCTLRTKVLLDSDKCPYCRAQQDEVLFTRDSNKSFEELKSSSIRWITIPDFDILCEDSSIYHVTSRMMDFQCPSKSCNVICNDWHDLIHHVRIAHNRMFCNMCIVNRKVFSSEHQLYTREELINHYNGNNTTNSTTDSSYSQGHPSCRECNLHFYDSAELYDHYLVHHQFVPNANLLRQPRASSHHDHHDRMTSTTNTTTTPTTTAIIPTREQFDRHLIEASDIDISFLIVCIITGLINVIGNITIPGCHDFERFFHSLEDLFVTLMNHDDVNNDQSFEIILRNMARSLYMVGGRCLMLFVYLMIIFWVLKGWFFIMSWVIYGACLIMFGKFCWRMYKDL